MIKIKLHYLCPFCGQWYSDWADSKESECSHCHICIKRNEDGSLHQETILLICLKRPKKEEV